MSARKGLARVFELHDAGIAQPGDFFWEFEPSLTTTRGKREAFEGLERLLQLLDDAAWSDLKGRAVHELRNYRPGRGWQALFDVLNEAKGFAYLMDLGAARIRFVPRTSAKTPDLEANLDGRRVLCEVKTINISDDEAAHRHRVHQGVIEVANTATRTTEEFLAKVSSTLTAAKDQLEAFDPCGEARRLVLLVVHFNDWVGDYQPAYFAQMDEHLLAHPLPGVELVVSPASNLFLRTFAMKSAIVWEPGV